MLDSISYNLKQDQSSYELCINNFESQLEILEYDSQSINNVILLLETLLTNIIKYSGNHEDIEITLKLHAKSIIINLKEIGKEFNPLCLEDSDFTIDNRQTAGGLGVQIINSISDDIKYYRISNFNIVSAFIKVCKCQRTFIKDQDWDCDINLPKFNGLQLMTPETLDELFSRLCVC